MVTRLREGEAPILDAKPSLDAVDEGLDARPEE